MGKVFDNVCSIYFEGIVGGNVWEVVEKYIGYCYIQYFMGVGDGVEGFLVFFEFFLECNLKCDICIVCDLEDGCWVFCSVYQLFNDGEVQWVMMDMFYIDEDGFIFEYWDMIVVYVEVIVLGEDMVGGLSVLDFEVDIEVSKVLVFEYMKQVVQQGEYEKFDEFVVEDLV